MSRSITIFTALWLIYGFLGFIIETTYVSVLQKKFVQRGFLTGPIIPIYAFGALIILIFLENYTNVLLVFNLGVLLTSTLEYIGHYLMEKIFHLKLWDYSKRFMNINGRVCLLNSTLFGILSVILVFIINPPIESVLMNMNTVLLNVLVTVGVLVTATDFVFSVLAALNIKAYLQEVATTELNIGTEQFKLRFNEMENKYKRIKGRLIKSYPDIKSINFEEFFKEVKERYRDSVTNVKDNISEKRNGLKDSSK